MGKGKGKRHFVPRPPRGGKMPKSSAAERFEYARKIWREDMEEHGKITVSINGANGMQMRLMEIFGCSARDAQLLKIRSEVVAEHREFEQRRRAETTTLKTQPLAKVLDLEPAPKQPEKTVPKNKVPGTTQSTADVLIRKRYAIHLFETTPGITQRELVKQIQDKYGKGLSHPHIRDARIAAGREGGRRPELRPPAPAKASLPAAPTGDPAEVVKSAVGLLLDECPDLEWLELKIVDGKPTVNYRVAVRRVEEGSVKL